MCVVSVQELSLPSKEDMMATAEEDMAEWTRRFKSDALRVKGMLTLTSDCLLDAHTHALNCRPRPLCRLSHCRTVA